MEYGCMYLRMYINIICSRALVSIKAKVSSISCFLEQIQKEENAVYMYCMYHRDLVL